MGYWDSVYREMSILRKIDFKNKNLTIAAQG